MANSSKATPEDIAEVQVTNFKESEWGCLDSYRKLTMPPYCNGSTGKGISLDLMRGLQLLRNRIGLPITITSGYRCPAYNKQVKGAANSQHLYGTAADIKAPSHDTFSLMKYVEEMDIFTGRGIYPGSNFIHVDVRRGLFGEPTRWAQVKGEYITLKSFRGYL